MLEDVRVLEFELGKKHVLVVTVDEKAAQSGGLSRLKALFQDDIVPALDEFLKSDEVVGAIMLPPGASIDLRKVEAQRGDVAP